MLKGELMVSRTAIDAVFNDQCLSARSFSDRVPQRNRIIKYHAVDAKRLEPGKWVPPNAAALICIGFSCGIFLRHLRILSTDLSPFWSDRIVGRAAAEGDQ